MSIFRNIVQKIQVSLKSDRNIGYFTLTPICSNDLVNKTNLVPKFFLVRLFLFSRCSGDCVSIIRRNNCIYATLGTCYSIWMTVWYAGYTPCIPDSHPHRITSTKCHINTAVSPDDGHTVGRNM